MLGIDADVIVARTRPAAAAKRVTTFVRELLDKCEGPLVLDADALNAFADRARALLVGREGRDLIITPHPGEMARLVGCTVEDLQADRIGIATDFAKRHKLYVVLKGYRTLVVTPDEKVFVNPTGCCPAWRPAAPAMCSPACSAPGSAQLLDAEAACKLAVYLARIRGRACRCRQRRGVDDRRRSRRSHRRRHPRSSPRRRRVATSKSRVSDAIRLQLRTGNALRSRRRSARDLAMERGVAPVGRSWRGQDRVRAQASQRDLGIDPDEVTSPTFTPRARVSRRPAAARPCRSVSS